MQSINPYFNFTPGLACMQKRQEHFSVSCWVLSMDALISRMQEHRSVKSKTLQTFVKNPGNCSCIALGPSSRRGSTSSIHGVVPTPFHGLVPTAIHGLVGAPCCVSLKFWVFVKGIAINCKRCLAGHTEIVHKNSSNCGF